MLLTIPNALNATQLATAARVMAEAPWIDGNATAGHQAMRAKHNVQIPEDHPPAVQLGEAILSALAANPLFVSAALPLKIFPPLFNRYSGGHSFGTHVDNSIRKLPGNPERVRTDLAATLFLVQPEEYDGGELCIEDIYGVRRIKLPAGHMVLYPADSLHHVTAVTRGTRTCAFFWIQSMIRDTARRSILLDLDLAIQRLSRDHPDHPSAVQLVGVYHNLVRQWAET